MEIAWNLLINVIQESVPVGTFKRNLVPAPTKENTFQHFPSSHDDHYYNHNNYYLKNQNICCKPTTCF